MAVLTDPATYRIVPDEAWRRLKIRSTKPKFLAVLRELAAWREREAQSRDVPRNRVLRDDALVDVAAQMPQTSEELARSRALNRESAGGRPARAVLAADARALARAEAALPTTPPQTDSPQAAPPAGDQAAVHV